MTDEQLSQGTVDFRREERRHATGRDALNDRADFEPSQTADDFGRTVAADAYHADDMGADAPCLSASIAHILLTASPRHAWQAHPKLNPEFKREEDQKFDLGKCAHAYLLQDSEGVEVACADDWRTKIAKEARDDIRAAGRIPVLSKDWARVEAMVDAVRDQLARTHAEPPLFTDGRPEHTLVWQEKGITLKARLDWLRDDLAAIDDLKTTSRSAHPDAFSRALYGTGADVQAAMYLRAVRAVTGRDPVFRWCVVETTPPFALSVITPGADVLALATAKVEKAIGVWRDCLEHDRWPAYPPVVATAELPPWEEARWLEREQREVAA